MNVVDVVAFDLDGTLLNDERQVSETDYSLLETLGQNGVLRVAATGRNLFSLNRVLAPDFPMDYAIFSSGAGIMNWKTKEILHTEHLTKNEIDRIIKILDSFELNYSLHQCIPNNHHLYLHAPHPLAHDLLNYTAAYQPYVEPINFDKLPEQATQFIVLLNSHVSLFDTLKTKMNFVKTILTTSPVDKKSMWIEVFNHRVSKANGLKWLCNHININNPKIMAIGNDYNDEELLHHSNFSFVVANAPADLKDKFTVVANNNNNGLSEAWNKISI